MLLTASRALSVESRFVGYAVTIMQIARVPALTATKNTLDIQQHGVYS